MTFREETQGRWHDILPRMGISPEYLKNKHGPCPLCAGKDRFRFDDGDGHGTWICNQCGAGAGVKLVTLVNDWDAKTAYREIRKVLGTTTQRQPKKKAQSDRWKRVWEESVPVTGYDPVERYLSCRGVESRGMPLRWHAALPYWDEGKKTGEYHAMVAPVTAPGGEMRTVHVTYLNGSGKADVPSPRKMLSTCGTGAAVRLMKHGTVLGIAEGIETAIAAWSIFGVPTWAALNAHLLETWQPPPQIREVVIYADNDASLTGQAAGYALGKRLRSKGIVANVAIPERENTDWADVLKGGTPC